MRGRLVRRAVRDGYRIVDILEYRGDCYGICRHCERGFFACQIVKGNSAFARPTGKPFACGRIRRNGDGVAVFGFCFVRRAAYDGHGILHFTVSCFYGDVVCRHGKGKFFLREIQTCGVESRNRPLDKCRAAKRICGNRDRSADIVFSAARAARDGNVEFLNILIICRRLDVACGHGKGEFGFREIQACGVDPRNRPLVKDFALGCFVCGNRHRIAVVRGRLIRRAVRYGYGIVDILEYRGDGNVFCRHGK